MSDDNENISVKIDGENITLAELSGLNMDDVQERRGEAFPKGVFVWEIDGENPPHLQAIGEGDKARAGVKFECKCIDVVTVTDSEFTGANDSLIGKKHTETFFISTMDSLGYVKAFVKDIGAPYNPVFKLLLLGTVGARFQAPIGKTKNKNDSDAPPYTNIVRGAKLKPLAAAAASSVAGAVAG